MSRWMLAVSVLAACARSSSVVCTDGTTCPDGTTCVDLGDSPTRCVLPDAFAACAELADGATCMLQGAMGVCTMDACIAAVCGDGIVDGNERCDDGNTRSDDGCSADCSSIETCSDGVTDLAVGEQCDDGFPGLSGDGCTSACRTEYDIWRDVTPPLPSTRTLPSVVTDHDGGVAMFGGFTGVIPLPGITSSSSLFMFDDHWSWNGNTWLAYDAPTGRPPQRVAPAVGFDPSRQRHVMFGGVVEGSADFTLSDELWEWDGITWTQIPKNGTWPTARLGAAIACGGGRCLMFGGRTGMSVQDLSDEVWSWDGTAWTAVTRTGPWPTKRWLAAAAYDSVNNRFVAVGGEMGASPQFVWSKEAWALPANGSWLRLSDLPFTTGAYPSAAFDPTRPANTGRVIVAAQQETSQQLDDDWTALSGALQLDARVAFSPALGKVVAIGKVFNVVRTRVLEDTVWTDDPPLVVNEPDSADRAVTLAYDARRGVTVAVDNTLIVQGNPSPETWEWNGLGWRRTSISGPVGAEAAGLAYDARCGDVVLYGGTSQTVRRNETWFYDGAWTQFTGTTPPGRAAHVMAYDAQRGELIVFGGTNGTILDETWRFSGPCEARAWTRATPAFSPPGRVGGGLAFDARRGVLVLFGGGTRSADLADTWEWNGITWTERTPSTSPPPRRDHAMAYDARRGRVVIFGGISGFSERSDTWEWDGTTWTQLQTVVSPPARTGMTMAPDVTGALVIVGGRSQLGDPTRTWRLTSEQIVEPRERCTADADDDSDGLRGCDDPDCWTRCAPLCEPGEVCAGPRCGDNTCDAPLETYASCAADCS
ncbi:MAG: hypothetical protein SFX73_28995 [Kofleriaceae bacterium]|nr:hypothetical protein [Kofleriaceae bacterium]